MSEGHGLQTIAALQRLAEKAADTIVELRDENAKLRDVITRAIENTHGHIIGCRFSFGERCGCWFTEARALLLEEK